jgi:hypothetical protein
LKVWKNTGTGFTAMGEWTEFNVGYAGTEPLLQFGDFNGDGKVDIAYQGSSIYSQQLMLYIVNSNGTGFLSPETYTNFPNSQGPFFLFDINGDGKTDIARRITYSSMV